SPLAGIRSFSFSAKGSGPFNSFLPRKELRETPFMDAVIKQLTPRAEAVSTGRQESNKPAYMEKPVTDRPSQEEVEAAVLTLLRWTGDNPAREGLVETPRRVAKAY